jgi:hypothetical protein
MMYWRVLTHAEYQEYLDSQSENDLDERTIDLIETGEAESENDHALKTSNSYSGSHMGEFWRDARNGGYFSYQLKTDEETGLFLMVRYWGNEYGNRTFDILIDGIKLVTENLNGKWNESEFKNMEYAIPDSLVEGKETVWVKFQALSDGYAGGAFEIRLLSATGPSALRTGQIQTADFKLYSNYPNPFNPDTMIRFLLPETCTVQLSIYDMTGKRVATPVHDELEPGFHTVNFHVGGLASGVYFCLLKTSDFSSIRKMVLVK